MSRGVMRVLQKRPEDALGVDISEKKVDIARIEKTDSGIRLVNFKRAFLPDGAVEDGIIKDGKTVSRTIKDMLDGLGVSSCSAATSVWGRGTLVTLKKHPHMPGDRLKEILEAEAENYLTFAGADILSDNVSVEEISEEGNRMLRVLFGMSKKEVIYSHLDTIKRANCEVSSVGLGVLEDLRAIYPNYYDNKAVILFVEFSDTYIFLLDRGVIKLLHAAGFGSGSIKEKNEFILRLSAEIDRVITFAQEFAGMASAEKIVLAGNLDGIMDADFVKKLEEELGASVETGNPLAGVDVSPDIGDIQPCSMTRSVGLAMRAAGIKTLPSDINLLPVEEIEERELNRQIRQFIFGLIIILIVAFFGSASLQLVIKYIENQTEATSRRLKEPTPVIKELIGIEKGYEDGKRELRLARGIIEEVQGKKMDEFLNEIKVIIPRAARLTRIISGENGLIDMSGEAASQEVAFDFVKKLRDSPYFKDIELKKARDVIAGKKVFTNYDIRGKLYFYREEK